jgi:hypothetical protein
MTSGSRERGIHPLGKMQGLERVPGPIEHIAEPQAVTILTPLPRAGRAERDQSLRADCEPIR